MRLAEDYALQMKLEIYPPKFQKLSRSGLAQFLLTKSFMSLASRRESLTWVMIQNSSLG